MGSDTTNATERITTLLEDRLPLDRGRDLKVPAIMPGDDAVRIRLKLGRYLLRSLAADADPLAVADAAAARLMPGMRRLEAARVAADGELRAHADRDMSKTGAPDAVYSDGTRILFASMGGHRPAVNRIGYRFRSSGRPVDTVSLADLMAADAIGAAMPALPDGDARRRLVSAMLDDDRRRPDVAGLTDPIHPAVLALSVLGSMGVDGLPAPPADPTDPAAWPAWIAAASDRVDASAKALGRLGVRAADRMLERAAEALPLMAAGRMWRIAVAGLLDVEADLMANRRWARRRAAGSSATVFEDKRECDAAHRAAGPASPFAADFDPIELDDDVDLDRFARLGGDWLRLKPLLPAMRVRAALRFRYTGRHRAAGVYHPAHRNIAVDPRHPSVFVHELMHHLDHTTAGHDLSLEPLFRPILDAYREGLDRTRITGDPERWLAPTEVFARAGELWVSRRGGDGSALLDTAAEYATRWDYAPFKGMETDIDRVFDALFA